MKVSKILKVLDGAKSCLGVVDCYNCPYNDHLPYVSDCKKKLMNDIVKIMMELRKEEK